MEVRDCTRGRVHEVEESRIVHFPPPDRMKFFPLLRHVHVDEACRDSRFLPGAKTLIRGEILLDVCGAVSNEFRQKLAERTKGLHDRLLLIDFRDIRHANDLSFPLDNF